MFIDLGNWSKRRFSISDLMMEMNTRLYSILPRGIFCCVIVADIDAIELHINEMTKVEREVVNADKEFNREVESQQKELDVSAIRILLEWASTQPDAPQILKDHETNAIAKRATRKPA